MEEFQLGTTVPHDEDCIQLGQPNYSAYSKLEANLLMKQIIRELGNPPEGCRMKLIGCNHDFGTYYDIALEYDREKEEHAKWALKVEVGLPSKWDYESRKELEKEGYYPYSKK
jgi:hypothetical protein